MIVIAVVPRHAHAQQIPSSSPNQIPSTTIPFSIPLVTSNSNPFGYEPLPQTRSQSTDIKEISPLTASRTGAQVDDYITFSVTIKNVAPYTKMIEQLCFESTDGNFGCQWGVPLIPNQTFTINNVGSWTTGGTKSVWITWSQDGFNYYEPTNANHVLVNIVQ